jgi:hypothetical protein
LPHAQDGQQAWTDDRGQYEASEDNLRSLLDRAKSGAYRTRRCSDAYPQGNGTAADRNPDVRGQGAAARGGDGAGAVYEQEFLDCSYGFRPGRGSTTLGELWKQAMAMRRVVVEVDIRNSDTQADGT